MNSPQNTPPNYEQILKSIQQKLEGLETHLSLKDTRVDFLAAQLKATQAELEATQSQLETTQSQLKSTQSQLLTTQSELKSSQTQQATTQSSLKDTQSQLTTTQLELKSTQKKLGTTHSELRSTRTQLGTTQSGLKSTQSQLATTRQELKSARQYTDDLLVGSVAAFAMPTPPKGWLECSGQAVSRTTYARLFGRIGIQFGKGDGSTTFNLPDLRGVFVRGWDKLRKLDAGRKFGSYQADQMQSHTHQDSGHSHGGSVSRAGSHSHNGTANTNGDHSHSYKAVRPESRPTIRTYRKRVKITSGFSDEFKIEKAIKQLGPDCLLYSHTYLQPTDEVRSGLLGWRLSFSWKGYDSSFSSISTNSAGSHSHSLAINSAGSHSHSLSISTSRASLGNPTASGAGTVRHGSETRPKNVALLFCIKH